MDKYLSTNRTNIMAVDSKEVFIENPTFLVYFKGDRKKVWGITELIDHKTIIETLIKSETICNGFAHKEFSKENCFIDVVINSTGEYIRAHYKDSINKYTDKILGLYDTLLGSTAIQQVV